MANDLGWANEWRIVPPEVLTCRQQQHKVEDVDVGPPHRGLEHVVRCDACGYVYRYDSSD